MNFVNDLKAWEKELGVSDPKTFSKKELETLYSVSYGMYQRAEYEDASGIFTKLILYDPYDIRFWKGLASSHQMQGQFKEALHAWSVLSLLTNHNPTAHFHAAECYLSMGNKKDAKKALQCAQLHLKSDDPIAEKIARLSQEVEDE